MKKLKQKSWRGFKLNLSTVCGSDSLRPAFKNVYFKDGFMYATDCHIAIKADVKIFSDFTEDEILLLNGKFLKSDKFKLVFNGEYITITENGFTDVVNDITYGFTKFDGKYANLDIIFSQIKEDKQLSIESFGINPTLLNRLNSAMQCYNDSINQIHLTIKDKDKAILVTSSIYNEDELKGLIMPVRIVKP